MLNRLFAYMTVLLLALPQVGLAAADDYEGGKSKSKNSPTSGSGISVRGNADRAKQEEGNAADKNNAIGAAMMAAGAAMVAAGSAMVPPNTGLIAAGAAMAMMGGQAMSTGSNMNSASNMSGNTGHLVSNNPDINDPSAKTKGAASSNIGGSVAANPKARESMGKLKDMGYRFDSKGNLRGPNGVYVPNVPLNSEKDLVAIGVPEEMAGKVMDAAGKAAASANAMYGDSVTSEGDSTGGKKKIADAELGDGDRSKAGDFREGGGGAEGSNFALSGQGADGEDGKGGEDDTKVSGKFRVVGGNDRIGVASDNIFDVIKARYKLKKLKGAFFSEKF